MQLTYPREFSRDPTARIPDLAAQVPIATVRDDVYVLSDGSMSAVFRLEGLQADLAGVQGQIDFTSGLERVLNMIPTGVTVKFLHRIHHNYTDLLKEHTEVLTGKNVYARYIAWDQARRYYEQMQNGELLRSDNLLTITYNPKVKWYENENKIKGLLDAVGGAKVAKGILQRTVTQYRRSLEKFEDLLRPIQTQIRIAGLKPQRLKTQDLYSLAWDTLNPRESLRRSCPPIRRPKFADPYSGVFADGKGATLAGKRPELTVVAPISEREQLCVSDWVMGDKWLRVDDRYYGCIYLKMLPANVYPGLALALAGLPFECTISVDATMLAKQEQLEKQKNEASSAVSKAQTTLWGAKADQVLVKEAEEKEQRRQQMANAGENPFSLRMVLSVAADSPKLLDQRCQAILTLLSNMETAQGVREQYDLEALYKTTWPFSLTSEIASRRALTSHIAALVPMFSPWAGSERPVTLLTDSLSRLVKHDPFPTDQANRNKTICGASGKGKSFCAQLADVQPHAARENTEIFIIESGGSFERTTRCFGGEYIKLGPSAKVQINPYDLPENFFELRPEEQETELRYKYGFIKNLIMAMVQLPGAEEQQLAQNVIGDVLQQMYADYQEHPAKYRNKAPRFRDFYKMLGTYKNPDDVRAVEVSNRIRTLIKNYVVTEEGRPGIYANYFDTDTTFDTNNSMVCFDLMDIKGDEALLTPMMMVTLMGLIYNRLMRRDKERLVIVDEAWALIKEKEGGGQSAAGKGIEQFWREGRKLFASSVMISQNYSDMTGDAVGRAVIGNSMIQYFLQHERLKANDQAFESAGFTPEKAERVYKLETRYGEFAEVMIKEGEAWGVVRLPSSGPRYWLATTAPEDTAIYRRYASVYGEQYHLSEQAIIAILAQDYPGGFRAQHGEEMPVDQALAFAERWTEHYQRFTELILAGKPVSLEFR